jgi:8-oxo-dGTP pyrophosphatase MutT (NUDIX family)
VVVFAGDRVVAVERPRGGYAFPGGGVERGESFPEGAARELREETGLSVTSLRLLHAAQVRGRPVVAFLGCGVSGELRSSHEGRAALVCPQTVLDGPFGAFAAKCFEALAQNHQAMSRR